MRQIGKKLRDSSLWLVGLGLMLASSGIDGAYMSTWMPPGFGWLGLVLNTTSDISGMVLVYWYARLQQDRSSRKRRLSNVLLAAEAVTVLYSWLFSWRQLRLVLPNVEQVGWQWVSAVSAGFIPLLLAFVGYAQALLAGRVDDREKPPRTIAAERPASVPLPKLTATIGDWRVLVRNVADPAALTARGVASMIEGHGLEPPSMRTCSTWARNARENGS